MVEFARAGICLDLPVPNVSSELLEPGLEVSELLWGKVTDGGLKLLDAHRRSLPKEDSPGKGKASEPPNW